MFGVFRLNTASSIRVSANRLRPAAPRTADPHMCHLWCHWATPLPAFGRGKTGRRRRCVCTTEHLADGLVIRFGRDANRAVNENVQPPVQLDPDGLPADVAGWRVGWDCFVYEHSYSRVGN